MENCTDCARLRAEAANIAAQRDEAEKRAIQAEERLRAVEADLARSVAETYGLRDELARIRAADRTSITAEGRAND